MTFCRPSLVTRTFVFVSLNEDANARPLEDIWDEALASLSPLDSKPDFEHQRSLARGFKREAERIDRPGTRFAVYLQSVVHFAMMARSVEGSRRATVASVTEVYVSTVAMMDTSKRSWNQPDSAMTLLDKVRLHFIALSIVEGKVQPSID